MSMGRARRCARRRGTDAVGKKRSQRYDMSQSSCTSVASSAFYPARAGAGMASGPPDDPLHSKLNEIATRVSQSDASKYSALSSLLGTAQGKTVVSSFLQQLGDPHSPGGALSDQLKLSGPAASLLHGLLSSSTADNNAEGTSAALSAHADNASTVASLLGIPAAAAAARAAAAAAAAAAGGHSSGPRPAAAAAVPIPGQGGGTSSGAFVPPSAGGALGSSMGGVLPCRPALQSSGSQLQWGRQWGLLPQPRPLNVPAAYTTAALEQLQPSVTLPGRRSSSGSPSGGGSGGSDSKVFRRRQYPQQQQQQQQLSAARSLGHTHKQLGQSGFKPRRRRALQLRRTLVPNQPSPAAAGGRTGMEAAAAAAAGAMQQAEAGPPEHDLHPDHAAALAAAAAVVATAATAAMASAAAAGDSSGQVLLPPPPPLQLGEVQGPGSSCPMASTVGAVTSLAPLVPPGASGPGYEQQQRDLQALLQLQTLLGLHQEQQALLGLSQQPPASGYKAASEEVEQEVSEETLSDDACSSAREPVEPTRAAAAAAAEAAAAAAWLAPPAAGTSGWGGAAGQQQQQLLLPHTLQQQQQQQPQASMSALHESSSAPVTSTALVGPAAAAAAALEAAVLGLVAGGDPSASLAPSSTQGQSSEANQMLQTLLALLNTPRQP